MRLNVLLSQVHNTLRPLLKMRISWSLCSCTLQKHHQLFSLVHSRMWTCSACFIKYQKSVVTYPTMHFTSASRRSKNGVKVCTSKYGLTFRYSRSSQDTYKPVYCELRRDLMHIFRKPGVYLSLELSDWWHFTRAWESNDRSALILKDLIQYFSGQMQSFLAWSMFPIDRLLMLTVWEKVLSVHW